MSRLQARVEKGRLVLDEPTTFPESTILELVVDDEGDDLSESERRALHDALSEAWRSAEAGRLRPALSIDNSQWFRFRNSCTSAGPLSPLVIMTTP